MSSIVVLKAGGSSVSDPLRLAQWLVQEYPSPFVLVVSAAMGRTNELIAKLSRSFPSTNGPVRDALLAVGELESAPLVAAALIASGVSATVLSPTEIFDTCGTHGDAAIIRVQCRPIQSALERGEIPVIGGFIGRGPDGLMTTLGRGGSDYSAVALAASLRCSTHLLKADVDGVYSADPRTAPSAVRFDSLEHDEAIVLAANGAKVLQRKAAELARDRRVPVWVRQTYGNGPGTWIASSAVRA